MKLEHEELEPFEPLLREISKYVFDYGLDSMLAEGLIRQGNELQKRIANDASAFRRFVRSCHYGYDLAQRRLVRTVVEHEELIRHLEAELKQQRRNRERLRVTAITELIRCLQDRQLVLRRLADSILFVLVSGKNWVLRRISIHDRVPRIDPKTIHRALEVATDRNRENRLTFSLISDLTTCVHIGDLVEVSFEKGKRAQWRIIELKEGRINDELSQTVQDLGESPSQEEVEARSTALDKDSALQLKRMLRQAERQRQFTQLITTDRGIDPKSKTEMQLTEEVIVKDFFEAVRDGLTSVDKTPFLGIKVQGGLNLAFLRARAGTRYGDKSVAHILHHLQDQEKQCALSRGTEEERNAEIRSIEASPPFLNLVEMNLVAMWPPPIFYWPVPSNAVADLISGRKQIFAQLDWDKFFDFARHAGVRLTWTADQDLQDMLRIADILPGSPKARAVSASWSDGNEAKMEVHYFSGFFGRLFLELMCPWQLLDIICNDLRKLSTGKFAHNS